MSKLNRTSFDMQLKRGTAANLALSTTYLKEGELAYTTDTKQLHVGDGTDKLHIVTKDADGNMALADEELETDATDGFTYIPTCDGTPTGTPTAKTGTVPIVYDIANDKLYVYLGSWKSVTFT